MPATTMTFSQQQPSLHRSFLDHGDEDIDTASQRSISLSSPPVSPRQSQTFSTAVHHSKPESRPYTLDTGIGSEADDLSLYTQERHVTPSTSAAPSVCEREERIPTYPPSPPNRDDTESIASFASGSSRKARPESMLVNVPEGALVLGIALVDFNHQVGPRIEYSKGDIFEDEEISKILPFLALPDGAHLSVEDYSYFHVVPSGPKPTTIFGISCNQQIAASALLVKDIDVTRSTVQKALVVLASKPIFGPIRDKLGVVTSAFFAQRDFTETYILDEFYASLETSLRSQLTASGLYIGTSLRELVHTFRHKVLVLVKALMLQKRIMFYGHPVERLCTYQYSLVSLLPGMLQTLDDCGSPPLAQRAPTLSRPTSLRTSDHKSMMAYIGLPLDLFGKDAFFQPYLPLQQLDMLRDTQSWLCGTTNTIVTQQKEIDLFINTETGVFEFRDPKLERSIGLTAADRKWMDAIVRDVNENWVNVNISGSASLRFKGSDDYVRAKFEEYISAALASVKYRDFIAKGEGTGIIITGVLGMEAKSTDDFNTLWIQEFKRTNAYEVWERITDPLLFDLVEPRHPCNERPTVVSDLGLRFQEGIQDLKLEQQLAPARETITRTIAVSSTSFFKAVEGVRGRWQRRDSSATSAQDDSKHSRSSTPVEVSTADLDEFTVRPIPLPQRSSTDSQPSQASHASALPARPSLASWGSGIGSFVSSRVALLSSAWPAKPAESMPSPSVESPSYSPPETTPGVDAQAQRSPTTKNVRLQKIQTIPDNDKHTDAIGIAS